MSEHRRKQTGIVLLILAVFLIATGSFPAEKHIQQTCIGRGIPETALEAVPHLSPEDVTNRGEPEELEQLYGIGPTLAESILKERTENGLFIHPEDLISVSGIGKTRLANIRPDLILLSGESEE